MNCIVLISIGKKNLLRYSLPSAKRYAKKVGADLIVITKRKFNLPKSDKYNYLTFEKFQVYDLFEKYDWILRLDTDILIKPNCPNIFTDKDYDTIYAVREDIGKRKNNRNGQIKKICSDLGQIEWLHPYFNSGVVLSHKNHKAIYELKNSDLKKLFKKELGYFKEQNMLNWKVNNLVCDFEDMGFKYNYLIAYQELGHKKEEAFIIHYAGKQDVKEKNMKEDYGKFFKQN